MTATAVRENRSLAAVAEAAVRDLVRVSNWGNSSFVNLPLIYPDGSSVTVKLDIVQAGQRVDEVGVRVSDHGFAYRLLEQIGAQRSFGRTAGGVAEREELTVDKRSIYVDVPFDAVERAICDVAAASWSVVDRVYSKLSDTGRKQAN